MINAKEYDAIIRSFHAALDYAKETGVSDNTIAYLAGYMGSAIEHANPNIHALPFVRTALQRDMDL